MSKIIINGKSDGALKTYCNGNEIEGVMAGDSLAYRKMETGTQPEPPAGPSYLCFTAETAGSTVALLKAYNPVIVPILYTSTDGDNWSRWNGGIITLANAGDKVYVYGENSRFCDQPATSTLLPSKYWFYRMTGRIAASGDVTSMLTKNGTATLDNYALFRIFQGCTSLTTAPALPATTLASYCYYQMFANCTALTTAPALPATTLASYCYNGMFSGCTNLTTAPATLPATTMAQHCYNQMFANCTALTTAPALPATTLATSCYSRIFQGCTALTTAPALPATTLAISCYDSMFKGCTALTTAPALPATTLASYCYNQMFANCTALTTAPALPATTLATSCYATMFSVCTALTTAPALPATTLATSCYSRIFQGCTALTTAPALPATTLAQNCYNQMFNGCTSIDRIEIGATTWSPSFSATWLNSVSATGTIRAPYGSIISVYSNSVDGIPSGWTLELYGNEPQGLNTLCFTAEEANSTVGFLTHGSNPSVYTLGSDGTWSQWDYNTKTLANAGDKLYVCGVNPDGFSKGNSQYSTFEMTGRIAASGNATTLVNTGGTKQMTEYCFYCLFNYCASLTAAPALPATTLARGCYANMLANCTSLTTAPTLPANTLVDSCYGGMFYGCTSLNDVKCRAEDISASNCTYDWLQGVSATGTFTKSANMSSWPRNANGIPAGWTVVDAS